MASDLAGLAREFERRDATVVIVHQGSSEAGRDFLRRYPGAERYHAVSDPERELYRAYGLASFRWGQLLTPRLWSRWVKVMVAGHLVGRPVGDGLQMPGVFIIRDGQVVAEHRYAGAGERPAYLRLIDSADQA